MAADDNGPMDTLIALDGTCRITDRGVIRASGPDAAAFLQGQLTNDVLKLGPREARLAGFCSAKGRLQASFVVWRDGPEDLLLACAASLLPQTLKRLSMFVLRAKCRLSDASAEVVLHGAAGPTASALLADAQPWTLVAAEGAPAVIRLPDAAGMKRALVATSPTGSPALAAAPPLSFQAWRWLEVESGIVTIEAETIDRFVPQMVNFELVGGVDFQKGCYPGQEVVARSQYRGTTKRRTFLFDAAELPALGADIYAAGTPFGEGGAGSEPVGTVANAAPQPDGQGAGMLVELRLSHLGSGSLHLGSPSGAALVQRALPYPVAIEPAAAG